jgi:tRNA-splicing ligase RtcB (3'-phosphate/5'-hydroxy nucleic acid ligase)
VHRKDATRAFGPGDEDLPEPLRPWGQPVLIGGSMGTGSYILIGIAASEAKAFSSACHGAGRALSRHAALRQWSGRKVIDDLGSQGILIWTQSARGVAEEAPGAYQGPRRSCGCRGASRSRATGGALAASDLRQWVTFAHACGVE